MTMTKKGLKAIWLVAVAFLVALPTSAEKGWPKICHLVFNASGLPPPIRVKTGLFGLFVKEKPGQSCKQIGMNDDGTLIHSCCKTAKG